MSRLLVVAACLSVILAEPVINSGYTYNSAEKQLNGFRPSIGIPCPHHHEQTHGRIINNPVHLLAESSGEPIVQGSSHSFAASSDANQVTVNSHIVVGDGGGQQSGLVSESLTAGGGYQSRPIIAAEVHDHSQHFEQNQGYVEQALPLLPTPAPVLPLIPVNNQFRYGYHHETANKGNHHHHQHGAIINGIGKVPPPPQFAFQAPTNAGVSNQFNAHASHGSSFGIGIGSPVRPAIPVSQGYAPAYPSGGGNFGHSGSSHSGLSAFGNLFGGVSKSGSAQFAGASGSYGPPALPQLGSYPGASAAGPSSGSYSGVHSHQGSSGSYSGLSNGQNFGSSGVSTLQTLGSYSGASNQQSHSSSGSFSAGQSFGSSGLASGHGSSGSFGQSLGSAGSFSAGQTLGSSGSYSGLSTHGSSGSHSGASSGSLGSYSHGQQSGSFGSGSNFLSSGQFSGQQNPHIDSALSSVIRDSIANSGLDPTVEKHIYVHVPPEEHDEAEIRQQFVQQVAPKKHYKIIFIKAPTQAQPNYAQLVANSGTTEEKTIVYVLVKKPEEPSAADLQALQQTVTPSKPEVYFIKYKNRREEGQGQVQGQSSFDDYHSSNYKNNEFPDLSEGNFEGTDLGIDIRSAKDSHVDTLDTYANTVSTSVTTSGGQNPAAVYGVPSKK